MANNASQNAAGQAAEAPKEKVKLTVSQIKEDLRNGIDRKGIGAKYGLKPFEVNALFQHKKLKGAKVRTAPNFELEDDTEEAEETTATASQDSGATSEANAGIKEVASELDTQQEAAAPAAQATASKGSW